jgi:hypothetical protein
VNRISRLTELLIRAGWLLASFMFVTGTALCQRDKLLFPLVEEGHHNPIRDAFLTADQKLLISRDEHKLICRDYASGRMWNALTPGKGQKIRGAFADGESKRLCVVFQPENQNQAWIAEFFQLPGLQFTGSRELPVNDSMTVPEPGTGCAGFFEDYSWKAWIYNGSALYSADLNDSLVWFNPAPASKVLGFFKDYGKTAVLAFNTPDRQHTQLVTLNGFRVLDVTQLHKPAHQATFHLHSRALTLTEDSLLFHYQINERGIPVFRKLMAHDWAVYRNISAFIDKDGKSLLVLMEKRTNAPKPAIEETLSNLSAGKSSLSYLFRFDLNKTGKKSDPIPVAVCDVQPAPHILLAAQDATFIAASYRTLSEHNVAWYGLRFRNFYTEDNNIQPLSIRRGRPLLSHGSGTIDLSNARPWHPAEAAGREIWSSLLQHSDACVALLQSDSGFHFALFPTKEGPAMQKSALIANHAGYLPELSRHGIQLAPNDRWLFMPDYLNGRYRLYDLQRPGLPFQELRLNDSSKSLLLKAGFSPDGTFLYLLHSKAMQIISFTDTARLYTQFAPRDMQWMDDSTMCFQSGDSIIQFYIRSNRIRNLEKANGSFRIFKLPGNTGSLWYYDNGLTEWRENGNRIVRTLQLLPGLPLDLLADPSHNRLYTANRGFIAVYSLDSFRLLYRIYPKGEPGNIDYILQSAQDNAYMAGPLAASHMHFMYPGANHHLIDHRFVEHLYNRPDKVLELTGHAKTAYRDALKKLHVKRISLKALDTGTAEMQLEAALGGTESTLRIHQLKQDPKKPYAQLLLSVDMRRLQRIDTQGLRVVQWQNFQYLGANGIVDRKRTGKERRENRLSDHEILLRYDLHLLEGVNKFTFGFTDLQDNLRAAPIAFNLYHHSEETIAPDLYYAGIGVSRYLDTSYNLQFATKDARDLQTALGNYAQREGFGRFHSLTILDSAAAQDFPKRIAGFLANAKPQDRIIVSYSGHGLLDEEMRYFLAPYAMNFNAPARQGVPVEALRDALGNAKSLHKLLLLDACHSGALIPPDEADTAAYPTTGAARVYGVRGAWTRNSLQRSAPDESDLMQAYFSLKTDRHGTVILAASGGREYALEGHGFRNGLFTASFIESLQQHKDVSNLARATAAKVIQRSRGAQTPRINQLDHQFNWNMR